MPVPNDEVERRVAAMAHAMRGAGLRVTHQRLEVAREIASTTAHPDVETVYRAVRTRVPTISLDTVYRTLGMLAEVGLVSRVTAVSAVARYDANLSGHHHFVCTRCGAMHDIDEAREGSVAASFDACDFGSVQSIQVQLRGVCARCTTQNAADRPL